MKNKVDISIVINTLGRDSLYRTLKCIFSQEINKSFEIILVLDGKDIDEKKIQKLNKNNVPIISFRTEPEWGFSKARAAGTQRGQGEVIALIDDDEWTKDNFWLHSLTAPIFEKKAKVTTSGYHIEFTGNYLTDCISLLGYPGGGALGFEKVWKVSQAQTTSHLAGGNFAFHHSISFKFSSKLIHGAEDTYFENYLSKRKIPILYISNATVLHSPRKGLINFSKWQFRRGKAIYEYHKYVTINSSIKQNQLFLLKNILKNALSTKYIFGVLFLVLWKHIILICGFFSAKHFK